jgi:ABC-type lipoprotein release transport system permease subunit
MRLILKMAFRNIFRQRRRSMLTGLMMAGGFLLFSLSIGLADGSYANIINVFIRDHTGHLQIHRQGYLDRPSLYKTIADPQRIMAELLAMPHVLSLAPRLFSPALAFVEKKTTGVQVIGIDPVRESETTNLVHKITQGRFFAGPPAAEIIIGSGLAEVLGLKLGDELSLVGQGADGSIANDNFKVIGILSKSGGAFDRMNCYMALATAQNFLALDDRVHEIAVLLDDQAPAREMAAAIAQKLRDPSLDVEPWQVVEREFYHAMQVDLKGNYVSQLIIMLIVAIGVLNTVLMSILERTREFGVLRAMGTRPPAVFRLIVYETALLSLLAISAGAGLSLALNYYFSVHGITMPTPIEWGGMRWDTMLSQVSWKTLWQPGLVTFLSAVAVSVPPGIRAARIAPVQAMRSH